jgi:hypothetical protein
MRNKKIIKNAQKLYNEEKWQEAIDLIDKSLTTHNEQIVAEGNRIKGWCYYYIGIKGDEKEKTENLEKAEEHFRLASLKTNKKESVVSVLDGLVKVLSQKEKIHRGL